MILLIVTLNVLGWPLIQLALARLFLLCPHEYFLHDSWLTRERSFENGGRLYQSILAVRKWKGRLPDGAPWLGGKAKRRIERHSFAALSDFQIETRRAEVAHWCMLLCTPIFCLWNPLWADVVMTIYGIAANVPCIVAQRANRIKIAHILDRQRMKAQRLC